MTNVSDGPDAAAGSTTARRLPSAAVVVPALALLLGLQPVTTDLYLPTLPGLRADLAGAMAGVQLTLSALILSFGFGQLFMGPVSDRFGRRPVLLLGLLTYVIASLAAAAAPDITALIAARAVQGLGMAASIVCARAMLRDLFEPAEGAHVMARALMGLGFLALFSPIVGGLLASTWGWRPALLVCAACGALAAAGVALALPETLPRKNSEALRLKPLGQAWARIATHPSFVAWALLVTCTYGGLYAFLAGSAFALVDVLGTSRWTYGLYLAACSASYIAGTRVCQRWIPMHGLAGTVGRGGVFSAASGLLMAGLAAAGVQHPLALVVPQVVFCFGHGLHQPCGQAAVTGPFPAHAGSASALAGFFMAAAAFGIGAWYGVSLSHTVLPMAYTQAFFAVMTAVVAWTMVQRHGQAPQTLVSPVAAQAAR